GGSQYSGDQRQKRARHGGISHGTRPEGVQPYRRGSGLRCAGQSTKRVLDSHTVVVLTVVQVFRMNFGAANLSRSGEDRRIVIADLKPSAELGGGFKELQGRFQNGKHPPLTAKLQSFVVGESQLSGRSRGDIEFLQNLKGNRKFAGAAAKQVARGAGFLLV